MSAYFQHAEELDHSLQKRPWSSGLDLSVQQKGHHEFQIQKQVCEYSSKRRCWIMVNVLILFVSLDERLVPPFDP